MNQLPSEQIIVQSPMSFVGSARRIGNWASRKVDRDDLHPVWRIATVLSAVVLIASAWSVILCWYVFFGVLLVPYRLLRRGDRNREIQAAQHRERLAALETGKQAS